MRDTSTLTNAADLKEMVRRALGYEAFAYDTETVGRLRNVPAANRLMWISVAFGPDDAVEAYSIPIEHPIGNLVRPGGRVREAHWDPRIVGKSGKMLKQWQSIKREPLYTPPPKHLKLHEVLEIMEPLFLSDRVKICHNSVFDIATVSKYYEQILPQPYEDTFVGAKLILPERVRAGLKEITEREWDHSYDSESVGKQVEIHPFAKVARYARLDALYTKLIRGKVIPRLARDGLEEVFALEMETVEATVEMMLNGVRVDLDVMAEAREEISAEVHRLHKLVAEEVGWVPTLTKTDDVSKIIYEDRGHEVWATTDKSNNPSTAREVIEVYSFDPVVDAILQWRKYDKLLSTYVGREDDPESGIRGVVHNGRVYTNLKPMGAATGRYSSSQKNLQNIPSKGETGDSLRKMFIASDGNLLVGADYSQIEYRIIAEFSQDPRLLKVFEEDGDPHLMTAVLVYGKDPEDVTEDERGYAKNIVFAIAFGAGPGKVASMMKQPVDRAKWLLHKHEREFPRIYDWKTELVRECRRRKPPHVTTLSGRRRYLPELTWSDDDARSRAERRCVNTRIQGTAADVIKMALVNVYKKKPDNWKMLLTVHDEIILETPEDEAEHAAKELAGWMEEVNPFNVPLKVTGAYGRTWKDIKG